MLYKLAGFTELGGSAAGTWTNRAFGSYVTAANGWAGTSTGAVINAGAAVDNLGTSQFVVPGSTASGLNPLNAFYSGVWTPSSFNGNVGFKLESASAAPGGQQNSILIKTGIIQPDPQDPSTWYDQYTSKFIGTDYGNGIYVILIPAPSTMALLGLSGAIALRRRR